MGSRLKKGIISCFIVLNLGSVLFMNRPTPVVQAEEALIETLDPELAYGVRYGRWLTQYYAFCTGLNNQWQMFGKQTRFNWWYVIKAQYGDGEPQVLPLPLQSKRTFWQAWFFDFKETKLQLNFYPRPAAREAYAHYLARQYPEHEGVPISSIIFELQWQAILSREEVSKTGVYLDSTIVTQVIQTVDFGQP